MASRAVEPQPLSRLGSRLAAAVLLACCALLLGAASIAAAHTAHAERSQQAGASSQTLPLPAPSAAPAAPAPVPAPVPAPSPVPSQPSQAEGAGQHHSASHESHQHHAAHQQPAAQGTTSTGQGTTTAGQGTPPVGQATASQPQATAGQAPSSSPASADAAPGSLAHRREERERRAKEERERHKEEAVRHKEARKAERSGGSSKTSEEGSSSTEPVAEGSSGATPGVSALATFSSPSPVATIASSSSPDAPATASAPSVGGVSQQAVDGHRTRAARRARTSRTHARATHRRAATAAASAALVAPAGVLRTSAHATPAGGTLVGSRAIKKPTKSSPLVTTITKIVGVVPTPIRILIAALAALALALAVRSRFSAARARRLERQRGQLLEDVGLLQAALLPVAPERLGPVGTSAAYKPADGPGAGGDFYDVFALEDGQLAVIVGDVSGHGRHALPHTALLRFTLRAYLEAGLSPRDAVQTAGAVLDRQLGGQFATVVAATYNPRERLLVYACAGHPAPVVLGAHRDAAITPITASSSPPIGVGMRTGTRQTTISVPGRAQVCFYTDGVTEARVGTELFGAERLRGALVELGPGASAAAVLDSVVARADARPDDMAACLLRVEGGEDAPRVLVEELELDRGSAASQRTTRFLLACGVERDELGEVIQAARTAAGRDGTAVLELDHARGAPQVTLRREHLRYLHVPQTEVEVSR